MLPRDHSKDHHPGRIHFDERMHCAQKHIANGYKNEQHLQHT